MNKMIEAFKPNPITDENSNIRKCCPDERIEEMTKIMNECCNRYDEQGNHIGNKCFDCECWCDTNHICCSYNTKEATALYNAGYRKIPDNIGEFSDGYHTFNELYHHRAILFSVICNGLPENAWKSKLHDTGDMYDGMFIVGIETPEGQATYHYDIEPYWDMFKVRELEKAPKWDGHTPQVAIERIAKLNIGVIRLWENLLKAEAQEVPIKAERIRIAREIFEEIDKLLRQHRIEFDMSCVDFYFEKHYAALKKKYTEGNYEK